MLILIQQEVSVEIQARKAKFITKKDHLKIPQNIMSQGSCGQAGQLGHKNTQSLTASGHQTNYNTATTLYIHNDCDSVNNDLVLRCGLVLSLRCAY